MNPSRRARTATRVCLFATALGRVSAGLAIWLALSPWLLAQFAAVPTEISSSVTLAEADSSIRTHLERIKAFVADEQWDDAVESLRRLLESNGDKLIAIAPNRYINLADYCHVQIAALPAPALALYHQRVDASAQALYEAAIADRDSRRLESLLDTMFCSAWGDDALWALGEIELERGHYAAASRAWGMLIELPPGRIPKEFYAAARDAPQLAAPTAAVLDRWYTLDEAAPSPHYRLHGSELMRDEEAVLLVEFWRNAGLPLERLTYPGTAIPRADIRARLILTSIMAGTLDTAARQLDDFRQQHPGARGQLAGRQVDYAQALSELLAAAANWPAMVRPDIWPTFAGDISRNGRSPRNLDLGPAAWPAIKLGEPLAGDSANARAFSLRRIGEDAQRLLSYHPLIAGDLVLWNNQNQIFALNRHTGQPAWAGDAMRPQGEIYADEAARQSSPRSHRGLGVPRFTLTVHENKLYARLGSPVTSQPVESYESRSTSYLVCLDLAAQGRLIWKPDGRLLPDDDQWAFEGAPLVAGDALYVAMRKSDVRPQTHVACYDAASGALRWRTYICAAETPGAGQLPELTHNLLTLHEGTLYYNTNLGAVAAIQSSDGRVRWATLYPRAAKGVADGKDRRQAHYYRDLNPCVYDQGRLLVAPTDCEGIFALDAANGAMLWETRLPEDAVHLLGVGEGNLLASGDALWWIDVTGGKIRRRWPDTSPLGHGRGLLMGNQVVWPTHEALYLFDQAVSTNAPQRAPILLSERGATGGNLVSAGDLLLIATADKLFAFRQQGPVPTPHSASLPPPSPPASKP